MLKTFKRYQPTKTDHQNIWQLAWPMILSNITVPLLGLVDTAVIGHLPDAHHLGAVAIGAMIFSIIYWAFGFLRMGTTGPTAQAFGKGDDQQNRLLLAQALIIAVFIGVSLIILQAPIIQLALYWMDAEPLVNDGAETYALIRIYGAPAVLCNYALLGWFVGNQNTRVPLLLLLIGNLSNMVLDVVAVYGFGMTTDGVALATVCAEYLTLIMGLYFARRLLKPLAGQLVRQQLLKLQDYSRFILLNRYLFVRTLAILFALAFFTAQGAKQGNITLSANAVLLNFMLLISNGLDGFAHATEALAGRFIGAKQTKAFYRNIMAALIWSLVTAILFSLSFLVAGEFIISLLTDIETVRATAIQYLPWIWILPLAGVWSFLLDGIFVGTSQVKAMQNTMLASVFLVYLPVWYISQPLQNHGLWLALICLFVARALSGGYVYWQICRKPQGWYRT